MVRNLTLARHSLKEAIIRKDVGHSITYRIILGHVDDGLYDLNDNIASWVLARNKCLPDLVPLNADVVVLYQDLGDLLLEEYFLTIALHVDRKIRDRNISLAISDGKSLTIDLCFRNLRVLIGGH